MLCSSFICEPNISILSHSSDSVNQKFQYCHARVILYNVEEVYIFEHGLFISALEHARRLILSDYVLLACTNTIYNTVTLGRFSEM